MLLLCLPLAAQPTIVDLNPARTAVTFTLGAVLHTVHGSFKLKRGNMRFDAETGHASGEIVVDLTSGNTHEDRRDRRMHKDILESARYPEAVFLPDRVTGRFSLSGESRLDVHGVFQLHGGTHEMTLHVVVQNGDGDLTATSDFTVPYVEWGLKNPSTFLLMVNDKIQMHIEASGHARQAAANPGLREP
jgi:polyisoprenoid-binding protein YceI